MRAYRLPCAWRALAVLAALLPACAAQAQPMPPPSTFGQVVGNAVLCLDQIDNKSFYSYLLTAFGPAYKHEGGAYWFRTDAVLWGAPVTDVIVSDDTSALVFMGVVADSTPEKLEPAIRAASGLRFDKLDRSAFPVRGSVPGSKIVYFRSKAKVYCAKYKPLPPARTR
ncbi:hypothetical protein [Janthinobacterium sp. PC23-8]|uniref:hypothetical protein n=1 Tax=Janthinobacterium sp. PC23-8 TaxID=2012679 RepID=UPI000B95DECC|nr:hypothetical protein [Janthinobacterium sp. PC23-8]OYO26488.1 hypothetical protein CD932_25000 [Janthinobacterium sp. PC23-8]